MYPKANIVCGRYDMVYHNTIPLIDGENARVEIEFGPQKNSKLTLNFNMRFDGCKKTDAKFESSEDGVINFSLLNFGNSALGTELTEAISIAKIGGHDIKVIFSARKMEKGVPILTLSMFVER